VGGLFGVTPVTGRPVNINLDMCEKVKTVEQTQVAIQSDAKVTANAREIKAPQSNSIAPSIARYTKAFFACLGTFLFLLPNCLLSGHGVCEHF
jgi:hypothetical protein